MLDDRDSGARLSPREILSASLLLALLTVILYWPQLVLQRVLYWGDIGLYFYPMDHLLQSELARGRVPLWNPYVLCGTPYVGNPQMAPFYPTTMLFDLFSIPYAVSLANALHVWLAGVGTYVFLRSIGLRHAASCFGAIVFMFGGCVIAKEQFPNMLQAVAYVPWVLWGCRKMVRSGSASGGVLLGVLIGLQILAAHQQVVLLTLYLGVIYSLLELFRTGRLARLRSVLGGWVLAGIVAAGISACEVLPAMQLVQNAAFKHYSFKIVNRFYLPPNQLLNFVLPAIHGHPFRGDFTARGNFWETCWYLGWLPSLAFLAAAILAWRKSKGRMSLDARFWTVVVIVGVWMATGGVGRIYRIAYYVLPGFAHFHDPARCLIWAAFGAAVLGAIGVSRLLDRVPDGPRRSAVALLICAVAFCDLWHFDSTLYPLADRPPVAAAVDAAVPSELTADPAMAGHMGRLIAPDSAQVWQRFTSHRSYRENTQGYARLWYETMTPNLPMSVGLYDAYGYDPVGLDTPAAILGRIAISFRPDATERQARLAAATAGAYGVRYVVSDGRIPPDWIDPGLSPVTTAPTLPSLRPVPPALVFLSKDKLWQPRVRLAGAIVAEPSIAASRACIIASENGGNPVDLSRSTLLCARDGVLPPGSLPAAPTSPRSSRHPSPDHAWIASEEPDEVDVRAVSTRPAVLVLADTWYPGWTVTVDGAPASILIADGFLRAVVLPSAGSHTVVFAYHPASVWLGIYLTLLTLAAVVTYETAVRLRKAAQP